VVAVGLLGDSAGFLAIAIRAAATDDPELASSSYELLRMFSYVFGIPLSFATLVTGALGLTSSWGILRYPWTIGKLLLIVSVILAETFVIDGALEELRSGADAQGELIAAASWDGHRSDHRNRPRGPQARPPQAPTPGSRSPMNPRPQSGPIGEETRRQDVSAPER
jgi:hypothetical protein